MKITKLGLHFNTKTGGINAFWKDIIRTHRRRNILFFLKQVMRGIIQ